MELRTLANGDIRFIEALYTGAFPESERAEFGKLLSFSMSDNVDFLVLSDNGAPKGMAYIVYDDVLAFLLYFAVDPSERGRGLGTRTLAMIEERYAGRGLFLHVEPMSDDAPNPEQRARRIAFYERNGFTPSGEMTTDSGTVYGVMCYGRPIPGGIRDDFFRRNSLNPLFG